MRAAHLHLVGRGPPTDEQYAVWLVEHFGCSPSQAIHEMRHNPHLDGMILAYNYNAAYQAVRAWDATPIDEQQGARAPAGRLVDAVRANEAQLVAENMKRRDEKLAQEGRA